MACRGCLGVSALTSTAVLLLKGNTCIEGSSLDRVKYDRRCAGVLQVWQTEWEGGRCRAWTPESTPSS